MALARHPDPAVWLAPAGSCEAPAGALRLLLGDVESGAAGTARQPPACRTRGLHRPCRRRSLRAANILIVA
ncbi:MAG: hypothetical protein K6E40_13690 [Desulfovibrio sp.]|nr:hypothetical protein [Desulfovibrio sp.]